MGARRGRGQAAEGEGVERGDTSDAQRCEAHQRQLQLSPWKGGRTEQTPLHGLMPMTERKDVGLRGQRRATGWVGSLGTSQRLRGQFPGAERGGRSPPSSRAGYRLLTPISPASQAWCAPAPLPTPPQQWKEPPPTQNWEPGGSCAPPRVLAPSGLGETAQEHSSPLSGEQDTLSPCLHCQAAAEAPFQLQIRPCLPLPTLSETTRLGLGAGGA